MKANHRGEIRATENGTMQEGGAAAPIELNGGGCRVHAMD